jgi:hypothetical protein
MSLTKSVGYISVLWKPQGDLPICFPLNPFLGRGKKFITLLHLLLPVKRLRMREAFFSSCCGAYHADNKEPEK